MPAAWGLGAELLSVEEAVRQHGAFLGSGTAPAARGEYEAQALGGGLVARQGDVAGCSPKQF